MTPLSLLWRAPKNDRSRFTIHKPDCCENPQLEVIEESWEAAGTLGETHQQKLICRTCSQKWESVQDTPNGSIDLDPRFASPTRSPKFFRHLSDD